MEQGFPGGANGKERICRCSRHKSPWVPPLGQDDPLEEEMVT